MAFLQDPRTRQRWNQITHDAEVATENAAAGIWSFSHNYINPCLGSLAASFDSCTAFCVGDADERRRQRRARDRERAEYSFDFYDDWYEEEEQSGGLLGGWGGEDWDRLLAGTGSQRRHNPAAGETAAQPQRKRGMSYGTKGGRRKVSGQDPAIIPGTQPIGFLGKLPFMGGTLRYKPSAASLKEHPGRPENTESAPLLGSDSDSDPGEVIQPRKRSGTTGSGDTSDSYRSRGDLFPSDDEGEEDAVPLDDDVTYEMLGNDDRSSGKTRRSSKGKRPAVGSRTVSRTTLGSSASHQSLYRLRTPSDRTLPPTPDVEGASLEDLRLEEEQLRQREDEKIARDKEAAAQLASRKGLKTNNPDMPESSEPKPEVADDENYEPPAPIPEMTEEEEEEVSKSKGAQPRSGTTDASSRGDEDFVPARLPFFG